MRRRQFIQQSLAATSASWWLSGCQLTAAIPGKIVGANSQLGHLLRQPPQLPVGRTLRTPVLIIGGGVSGLSTAYHLSQKGYQQYTLVELETHTGGNARAGSNAISPYPWGAHYVPVANNNCEAYLQFLQSADVVTGYQQGKPVYNETMLCHDPEERLYINGRWQEGLVPHWGVSAEGRQQISRFLQHMEQLRQATGADGRQAFAIPVAESSTDDQYRMLDQLTMQAWMQQQGYQHPDLLTYVNYCTRDDYGTAINRISAWAGIHYFAGRKGQAANADAQDVLTWPQGNQYLTDALRRQCAGTIMSGHAAYQVLPNGPGWRVLITPTAKGPATAVDCQVLVLATPQFVNARLINNPGFASLARQLPYSPWMVANLTVDQLDEQSGMTPCWDNVLHGGRGLGYVDATHQLLQWHHRQRNLTYYLPLTDGDPANLRRWAQQQSHADWCQLVLSELEPVHPNLRKAIRQIDVMLWGHAMIQPLPGLLWGPQRQQLRQAAGPLILAHTDMAGISIFEEGFYQGLQAAQQVWHQL
jgi:glycine/D-amino acid oxidase-like deaminating enzyme